MKDPPFLSSVNHLFLWAIFFGYVSHNQRVNVRFDFQIQCFPVGRTCSQDWPIHTGGVSGGIAVISGKITIRWWSIRNRKKGYGDLDDQNIYIYIYIITIGFINIDSESIVWHLAWIKPSVLGHPPGAGDAFLMFLAAQAMKKRGFQFDPPSGAEAETEPRKMKLKAG